MPNQMSEEELGLAGDDQYAPLEPRCSYTVTRKVAPTPVSCIGSQ